MKRLSAYLIAAIAIAAAGCDSNIPETGTINNALVSEVVLDDFLASGLTLETGDVVSLPQYIKYLPEDATNTAQQYESDNTAVATVDDAGTLTAIGKGNCTITVYIGAEGVFSEFPVTVNEKAAIAITSLRFLKESADYELAATETADLRRLLSIGSASPTEDATEAVLFESSAPAVASIDEDGILTPHKLGKITVTAKAAVSQVDPATIDIGIYKWNITEYERFEGDAEGEQAAIEDETWYWEVTASQNPLPDVSGRNNSLTAMIDGRQIVERYGGTNDPTLKNGTAFCLCCPGRNTGGVNLSGESTTTYESWFTINMKQTKKVNYFRISNISTVQGDVLVRYKGFSEILGSNNGTDFTSIVNNISFDNAIATDDGYNRETANIEIPTREYQYLKFRMLGTTCYGPLGTTGGSAQIEEFYMGYQEKVYEE